MDPPSGTEPQALALPKNMSNSHLASRHPAPPPAKAAFQPALRGWVLAVLAFLLAGPVWGQMRITDSSEKVEVHAVLQRDTLQPGQDAVLAVVLNHDEHWHTQTHDADVDSPLQSIGVLPVATDIRPGEPNERAGSTEAPAVLPFVMHRSHIQWPTPKDVQMKVGEDVITFPAYEGRAVAFVPITVASDAAPGAHHLQVAVTVQACDDRMCLRPADLLLTLPVQIIEPGSSPGQSANTLQTGEEAGDKDEVDFSAFDASVWPDIHAGVVAEDSSRSAIVIPFLGDVSHLSGGALAALMLGLALLGGMLLNATPCVLPVIPLKVMAIAHHAGSRRRTLWLGLWMAAGLVVFWLIIATLMASVQGFQAVNQLFQYGGFGVAVGVLIAVLGVGMMGLFTIGLPKVVYQLNPTQDTATGSFFNGILAAVLATPCAGPFMAWSIAWSTQLSPVAIYAVFLAIGVGMALPYLVLSANPGWAAKMPRTGPGSELIKQVMGLMMLAAAVFFVGSGINALTADGLGESSGLYWWGVAALIAAAGVWLAVRMIKITSSTAWRVGLSAIALVMILTGIGIGSKLGTMGKTAQGPIDWVYYNPEVFEEHVTDGQIIVMDFTADWCLNCKALEKAVLESDAVAAVLAEAGVTPMKVDITSARNQAGNAKLAAMGHNTIPLLVVFDSTGEPIYKSDLYTSRDVLRAIEQARGGTALAR